MYDLFVPHQAYEKQLQQMEQQIAAIEDSKEMVIISLTSLTKHERFDTEAL